MQHASASSAVATASAAMAAAAAANRMLSHKVAGTLFPVGLGASSNVSKTHAPSLNSSHQQQTRAAPDAAVTSASLVSPSKVLVLAQDDGSVRGTGEGRRQMLVSALWVRNEGKTAASSTATPEGLAASVCQYTVLNGGLGGAHASLNGVWRGGAHALLNT
jgi:hypothetical protein